LNIVQLLIDIKADVSSIKSDIVNFKETQRKEKETFDKALEDLRDDYEQDLRSLEDKVSHLTEEVDVLQHAEAEKDAKRWRTVITYILTAVGSMLAIKLPDIIRTLIVIFSSK